MNKNRLEAFSDGVLAILITIMVLELKIPHSPEISALKPLAPVFLSYLISFIYIGIYWNNHHHLFQLVKHVSGQILWANAHLLFWLSLVPFVTAWSGENHFAEVPVALYGAVLLMAGFAYSLLSHSLVSSHGENSEIAKALGKDFKGNISLGFYSVAIPLAFWQPRISLALYVIVAMIWLIPDSRIEKMLKPKG